MKLWSWLVFTICAFTNNHCDTRVKLDTNPWFFVSKYTSYEEAQRMSSYIQHGDYSGYNRFVETTP